MLGGATLAVSLVILCPGDTGSAVVVYMVEDWGSVVSVLKVLDWDSEMDKICGLWEVGAMLLIPGDVDCAEVGASGGASVPVNTVVLKEAVVGLLGLVVDSRLVIELTVGLALGLMVGVALVLLLWLALDSELDPRFGTVVIDPVPTTVTIPFVTVLVPPPFSARSWQLES